jgi:hypothetical protein
MDPQTYNDLMRQLAEIRAKHLRWIAEQDPTLTRLKQVLEEERAIMQMDSRALLDFCAKLQAKYGIDHGRDT